MSMTSAAETSTQAVSAPLIASTNVTPYYSYRAAGTGGEASSRNFRVSSLWAAERRGWAPLQVPALQTSPHTSCRETLKYSASGPRRAASATLVGFGSGGFWHRSCPFLQALLGITQYAGGRTWS